MKFKVIFVTLFFTIIQLSAQSTAKDKFFADYAQLLEQARSENGAYLSPENFKMALSAYEEALNMYDEKESQKDIRKKLDESADYAEKALGVIHLAQSVMEETILARDAALTAQAPLYEEDMWDEAEELFLSAVTNLEDEDIDDAREYAADALQIFNQAELLSIKKGILGAARQNIKKAKSLDAEEYAYRTITDAENILMEAEKLLEGNRYAKDEALNKAEMATKQGEHAIYLSKTIKELSKKEDNWEILFLKFEEILSEIGAPFNYTPTYENGFNKAVKTLSSHINTLKEEKKLLLNENSRLKEQLKSAKENAANYSAELAKKEEKEQRIKDLNTLFTTQEAKIVYEGEKIIIRLIGLNFPSGKEIIQPEYFSLLTKVQHALRLFKESHYLVEGHTDALGNNSTNKLLSEQRAQSVQEYLTANMELPNEQISYMGYGESKPIASNETKAGRAQNRRIDIVITLSE